MILKIQVPIFTNEPNPAALIYNEDRTTTVMAPVGIVADLMDGRYKIYVEGSIDKDGKLVVDHEVDHWPEW